MSDEEHQKIEKKLKKEYVGKVIWEQQENYIEKIADVFVDYRPEAQHMNRVITESGNVYFISELPKFEKGVFKI